MRWFGLGLKLGGVFAGLAVVLAGLYVFVALEVAAQNRDFERVLEEHREEGHGRGLVYDIRLLEAAVRSGRRDVRALLERAQRSLDELAAGPGGNDPSEKAHESAEGEFYERIARHLQAASDHLGQPDGLAPTLQALARALDGSETLHGEMEREVREASARLLARGIRLNRGELLALLGSLGFLAMAFCTVLVQVVRPLRALRRRTQQLGEGRAPDPLPVPGRDEIGDLAREFSHMAQHVLDSRRGLEARVRERTTELARAARLASLGTLATGIAHEINTPLASIASCAEGLERRLQKGQFDTGEAVDYLRIIAREAYRVHGISARLLEFARETRGKPDSVDLGRVVRDTCLLLEHQFRRAGVALETEIAADLPAVRADAGECKQVLLNLLSNALDACHNGDAVRILARRTAEGRAELRVSDSGPGVDAGHRELIFDPFFSTKRPGEGTGLGLAIAHRIVADHGGQLELLDTDRGATFRLVLPAAKEDKA